nr:probable leucine-rich repeat receptor-like serine/threonine-protein kinase At3g14840 [Ipomoea batatas]
MAAWPPINARSTPVDNTAPATGSPAIPSPLAPSPTVEPNTRELPWWYLPCAKHALTLQKKGNLMKLIDPRLGSDFDKEEALRMTKVALLCTNHSPVLRPSMSEVVSMLEGHDDILEYKSDLHEFNFEAMRDHYDEMLGNSSISPHN